MSSQAEQFPHSLTADRVRLLLVFPIIIGSLDMTMITAFVAQIALSFNMELSSVGIIVTGYLITYTLSILLAGRVSDYLGRRQTFALGMVLYIMGSVVIFIYPLFTSLGIPALTIILIGRLITGAGAGTIPSIAVSVMCDLYPKPLRSIGIIGAADILGVLSGALYGGIFVQVFPWRFAFAISVLIGIASLLTIYRTLPSAAKVRGTFDWVAAVLICICLATLILGLTQLEQVDIISLLLRVIPLLALSSGALILFALWESRSRDNRLLDLEILYKPGVVASMVVTFFSSISVFIMLTILPLLSNIEVIAKDKFTLLLPSVEQNALNQAALISGMLMLAYAGALALCTNFSGKLQTRFGTSSTVIAGLALSLIGFGLMRFAIIEQSPLLVIGAISVIVGIGLGIVFSPVFDKPLAAATTPSMIASVLLAIRMTAGACVLTTITVVAQARIDFLFTNATAGRFPPAIQIPKLLAYVLAYDSYYRASIQMLSEAILVALLFCLFAMWPALRLRRIQ